MEGGRNRGQGVGMVLPWKQEKELGSLGQLLDPELPPAAHKVGQGAPPQPHSCQQSGIPEQGGARRSSVPKLPPSHCLH